jgi:hypothetical protein
MEQLLAGESGCQQILVLGDEIINDLLLQPSSLEKNQKEKQNSSCLLFRFFLHMNFTYKLINKVATLTKVMYPGKTDQLEQINMR